MPDGVPTRVLLCSFTSGKRKEIVDIRWSESTGVSFTVLDPEGDEFVPRYYRKGVPSYAERRRITPDEPEAFMRALVEPRQSSYLVYEDHSGERPDGGG